MKNIRTIVATLLLLASSSLAREDVYLSHALRRWQFVVVVKVQSVQVDGKIKKISRGIIEVLRGKPKDLPKFEFWLNTDQAEGKYYLMCYHKSPPGTSAWQSFNMKKNDQGFTILAMFTNDHSKRPSGHNTQDLSLKKFEALLKEVPFQADP